MAPEQTIEGVNPAAISGSVRGEFGPQPFDTKTNDELAALEAKINATEPQPEAPPAPTTPVAEAPAKEQPQGIEVPDAFKDKVPEKFKNPDGTLNDKRLEQSMVNLEHYLNLEKNLGQKAPQPQYQPPQYQQPQYTQPPNYQPQYPYQAPVPLETRVNEDIQKDPGTTVVNLMRAAVMQAEQSSSAQLKALHSRLELMEIAQRDPEVFTKQGAAKIEKTLTENPWLWQSPTPFASAYKMAGGLRNDAPATAPARRATAPILPGGQAPAIPQGTSITSEADLRRHLNERAPNDPFKQAEHLERIIMEMNKNR